MPQKYSLPRMLPILPLLAALLLVVLAFFGAGEKGPLVFVLAAVWGLLYGLCYLGAGWLGLKTGGRMAVGVLVATVVMPFALPLVINTIKSIIN